MTLKELRGLKSNLTQKQIAEKLDITEKTYNKYENNPKHIPISLILKLSHIYNVAPSTVYKASMETYKGQV